MNDENTVLTWQADSLVPLVSTVTGGYQRNYIRQAVCELRFPTLMSLSDAKPPPAFVAALRKRFPIVETMNELTVGAGESSISGHAHQLKSTKLTWTATLKQNAVSIETTRYTTFDEFRVRVQEVIDATIPVIDSDFFTRIGLRYINVIPTDSSPITDWINPALAAPLHGQGFKGISEYAGRFAVGSEDGGCLLQHGIRLRNETSGPAAQSPDYVIDVDSFRSEVQAADAMTALDTIHRQAFSLFKWALGVKASAYLVGEGK